MSLLQTLDRPIAYQRCLVPIAGVTGAVLLSQAIYWQGRVAEDGWFYKTRDEWFEETGLTRYEQEGARKKLKEVGILEERLGGQPARLFYRVNTQVLASWLKTHQLVGGKPTNKMVENQPTHITETTSENTTESKKVAHTIEEDALWPEYCHAMAEWNQAYGTRYKTNEAVYSNYINWSKTYDIVDIICAIKMIRHEPYWSDKMTPTILFRQRTPSGEPCDRIGDMINLRNFDVSTSPTLSDYAMLRKWFDEGKKPGNLKDVVIPLKSWGFTKELEEAVKILKGAQNADK